MAHQYEQSKLPAKWPGHAWSIFNPSKKTQQIVTGQKKVRVAASVLMISEESRPDRVESEEVELA